LIAILLAYLILNALALALFAFDKGRAVRGGRRIEENILLLSAWWGRSGLIWG